MREYDNKTKKILKHVLGTFTSFMTTFVIFDGYFNMIIEYKGLFKYFDILGDWFNNIGTWFERGAGRVIVNWLINDIQNPILRNIFKLFIRQDGSIGLQTLHSLFHLAWVLFVIAMVVFAVFYPWYRFTHRKDVEHHYQTIHRQLNAEIADLVELIEMLEAKFYIAGEMLGNFFTLTSTMQQRHSAITHFIVNLKEWYRTTLEAHEKMCAEARAPFISLIRNDILNAYYKTKEESIIEENNLWRFIENYEPSEDGIILVQQDIKNDLLSKIKTHFEKFSIADYLINLKDKQMYQYLIHDFDDVCILFNELNRKSDIFMQYNIEEEGRDAHQVMFVHTDDEAQRNRLENELHHALTDMDIISISSPYKIIFLQKHDLEKKQLDY